MEFSEQIKTFLDTHFPEADIYNMSLEQLKSFKKLVSQKRQEYSLLELAMKTSGNAAYGACASPYFYFFNPSLAGDITGECRELTQTMWKNLNNFFRETIWERRDLWKRFDFELDESKHEWAKEQDWACYSDTDTICWLSTVYVKEIGNFVNLKTFYDYCLQKNGLKTIDDTGHEIVESDNHIPNYVNGELVYSKVKHVIRHKITKPKYRITTKSGKTIEVTDDHSCIVFRDGQQLAIKAKDINPKTDKILSIKIKSDEEQ